MGRRLQQALAGLLVFSASGALTAETVYVIDKLLVGIHAEKSLDSAIIKVFSTGTQLEVLQRDGDLAQVRGPEGVTGWVDAVYLTKDQPAALVVGMLEAQNRKLVEDLKTAQARISEMNQAADTDRTNTASDPAAQTTVELASARNQLETLQLALDAERGRSSDLQQQLNTAQNQPRADAETFAALKGENEALKRELEDAQIKAIGQAEVSGLADALPASAVSRDELLIAEGLELSTTHLLILGAILLVGGLSAGAWFMDFLQRRRHGGFRI